MVHVVFNKIELFVKLFIKSIDNNEETRPSQPDERRKPATVEHKSAITDQADRNHFIIE